MMNEEESFLVSKLRALKVEFDDHTNSIKSNKSKYDGFDNKCEKPQKTLGLNDAYGNHCAFKEYFL